MFLKKTENRVIGLLFSVDGEKFTVEEVNKKYSRYLSNAFHKTNTTIKRELIIKNHDVVYEPHEIIDVKLDLRNSSQLTNEALLEYLQFAGQINGLIQKSILNIETVMKILEEKNYHNSLTKNLILIYQDVFTSQSFLDSLNYFEKLKLYTENRYRTQEIMDRYKEDFDNCIYELFKNYMMGEGIDISENPSILRNVIISTVNEFYGKEIGFLKEKDKALYAVQHIENELNYNLQVANIVKEAVVKHKILGENWKELKESSLNIAENLLKEAQSEIDSFNLKKNIIRYFPK